MRVRDPNGKYWLPFLPDAYVEIAYADGRPQCTLVEIDMGTLTLRRFARKVLAGETALARDVFHKHFKRDEFEVLVLTQSEHSARGAEHQPAPRRHRRAHHLLAGVRHRPAGQEALEEVFGWMKTTAVASV